MKLLFTSVLLWAWLTGTIKAQDAAIDTTYGEPIVVLIVTDPWLMVMGSDVPTLALYEKGQVIYTSVVNDRSNYFEAWLSVSQRDAFIAALELDNLARLPREVTASEATDQPDNIIYAQHGDSSIAISVYGYLREKSEGRKHTPKAFLKAFDLLLHYTNPNGVEWTPNLVEVMIWDFAYAANSRPWPNDWPDLESSTTVQRSNGMYSIYFPGGRIEELRKFIADTQEKEAVVINGKKMTMALRFPFPNI